MNVSSGISEMTERMQYANRVDTTADCVCNDLYAGKLSTIVIFGCLVTLFFNTGIYMYTAGEEVVLLRYERYPELGSCHS